MYIRINTCSNKSYWYAKHINEIMPVVGIDRNDGNYWCREMDQYRALNFVLKVDATVVGADGNEL